MRDLDELDYKNGVSALKHHYEKCIDLIKILKKNMVKMSIFLYQAGKFAPHPHRIVDIQYGGGFWAFMVSKFRLGTEYR